MGSNKKNNFYLQGSILAAASILTRIMGIAFRIPLTRIIGDEGIGAYSNAYEIYNLALTLSTYSIPIAVSRLVSAREAKREYINAYRVLKTALCFSGAAGAIAALITFFGAEFFAETLFKSASSAIPLRFLAPTVFVFAIMGVLRGFFQGKNTVFPTSISQLIEQFFHVVVGLIAAVVFMELYKDSEQQVAYGAAGGTFGTLVGAITSLAFLIIVFFLNYPVLKHRFRKDCGAPLESSRYLLQVVIITVLPIVFNQTLNSLNGTLDSFLLNTILSDKGYTEEARLILWGRYSSKYRLLANLPLSIASAIGVAIIPNIVRANIENDLEVLYQKTAQAVKFNMLIAIPSAFGLAALAKPIMEVLFGDTSAMTPLLMQLGALAIVLYAYATTTSNILQGLNLLRYPILHSALGIVIYGIVDYILLSFFDMSVYALIVGHTIFPLIVSLFNWIRIQIETGYVQEVRKTFLMPTFCGAIMAFIAYFVYLGMETIIKSKIISLCVAIFFAIVVYFVLMIATKTMEEQELRDLPMGGKLVRLAKSFGLLRE